MPHLVIAIQFIDDVVAFFNKVFEGIASALFVFGNGWDIVRTVIDIAICAAVFYFVLALVRNTRAWQLLKGLILIIVFSLFSGFLGLQTMNYILSSTISFLAIALLVIFQPESRRALEKMGRKTGGLLSTVSGEPTTTETVVEQLAQEIAIACKNMARDRCGALIIIERQTSTAELADQPNAIKVDAAVTAMNLMQIFYEGSPMHDGAVLIRNGRIYAARCHVPLSEDTRVKDGLGTRHRAAIGASEMSDAIGVVVSEERGTISLTLEGRLYRINDSEKLRRIILRLMMPKKVRAEGPLLQRLWQRFFVRQYRDDDSSIGIGDGEVETPQRRQTRSLKIVAILAALLFWFYVQATINPIRTVTVTVPVQIYNMNVLDQANMDYRKADNVVNLEIRTRKEYESMMTGDNITASLDFKDLDVAAIQQQFNEGAPSVLVKLDVKVDVRHLFRTAYKVTKRIPPTLYVSFYPAGDGFVDNEEILEPGQTTVVIETTTSQQTESTSTEMTTMPSEQSSSQGLISLPQSSSPTAEEATSQTDSETTTIPVGMPSVIPDS